MKNNKLLIAIMLVFISVLCFGGVRAYADVDIDRDLGSEPTMTISPPQQKIVIIPGETFEGSIQISNRAGASKDLKYSVSVGSFSLSKDENGNTDYNSTDVDTITAYNQIMDWIELEKTEGSVAPNTTDVVPFMIHVPEDAPAGGQYATIIFQNDTDSGDSGGNVSIQNVIRFAASIFAEVAGETRNKGEIISNSVPSVLFTNKLTAESVVRNDGNVHTNAKYTLQVWPLFSDEEICTNEENPGDNLVMPETERVHVEECVLPKIGFFRAKQTVQVYGETSIVERIVFVCPLWLLFVVVFAIVVAAMWLVKKTKARRSSKK